MKEVNELQPEPSMKLHRQENAAQELLLELQK
jgi:hypothetical protein